MKRIVIMISGRGSNMRALFEANLPARIVAVISNNAQAAGLEYARKNAVETHVVNHKEFSDREAFDHALAERVHSFAPDLIVLAGFMRILTEAFVSRFSGRVLNIHPSLLPAFAGLDTHQRALDEGVRLHGCTVHFVTTALDHGPIIVQAAVPVLPDDDAERLAARVLDQEHRIYPIAVRWFLDEKIALADGRVQIKGTRRFPDPVISPDNVA
jgi:phosphoribosylglycinamide formyltransferase-1